MVAPYRLNLKSKSHWSSHLEGLTEMSRRNYSLKVQTSCFALQLTTFSPLAVHRPSTPSSTSSSPWRWWWRWWPWASSAAAVTWETPGTAWTSSSSWPGERPSRQRRLGWWFRLFVFLFVGSVVSFGVWRNTTHSHRCGFSLYVLFGVFFFPFCFRIGSFQAGRRVNVNWIPTRLFCYGKCTDSSTRLRHVSGLRMEAGASLLCISYQ